ncbi:hypothetical protein KAR34_00045 [bacterium]|nr:hypothetical protein [bacterium]
MKKLNRKTMRKLGRLLIIGAGVFLCGGTAEAADIWVETPVTATTINSAIASAQPGDTVIIPDGTYHKISSQEWPYDKKINVFVNGKSGNEITIRSETPGGVTFSGTFCLYIYGDYVVIKNFVFKEIYYKDQFNHMIELHELNHSRITNNLFQKIGDPSYEENGWAILLTKGSSYNRIDHNSFFNFYQQCIYVSPRGYNTINNQIDHNYFKDAPAANKNTREAMQIGDDYGINDKMFTNVEYNFFENWIAEAELISNKGSNNFYRYNVIKDSKSITLRGGNDCIIEGNYFLGLDGLRIFGKNHTVKGNFFEDISGTWGIVVNIGTGSQNYETVENLLMQDNTFVNCPAVSIYFGYPSDNIPPKDINFIDNLIIQNESSMINCWNVNGMSWKNNLLWNSGNAKYWTNRTGLSVCNEPSTGISRATELPIIPQVNLPVTENEVGPTWLQSTADLNQDGRTDIQDIQLCVNVVLETETDPDIVARADVNKDGSVNTLDIQEVVNAVLN